MRPVRAWASDQGSELVDRAPSYPTIYAYSLACYDECFFFAYMVPRQPRLELGFPVGNLVSPFAASSGRDLYGHGPRVTKLNNGRKMIGATISEPGIVSHSNVRQDENRKLEQTFRKPRPLSSTCGEPRSLVASHHLTVPWSICLVCSHRANTGLGTVCCGFDLTCQRDSRKGKPEANEIGHGKKVTAALVAIRNGRELQKQHSCCRDIHHGRTRTSS